MSCHLSTIRFLQKLAPLTLLVIVTITVSACKSESETERNSGNSGYAVTGNSKPVEAAEESGVAKDTTPSSPTKPGAVPTQPPTVPSAQLDTDKIPEGNAKELLAYIEQLSKQPLQGASEQEAIANLTKTQKAISLASTKLLTMEISDKDRETVIEAKLRALAIMGQIGVEGIDQEMLAFAEELSKSKNTTLAFMGRKILFGTKINDIQTGTNKDFAGFLQQTRDLLDGNKNDEDVFLICQQAALSLANVDQADLSNQLFQDIGNTFKDSDKPELVREAQNILQQTLFFDLKIEEKIAALLENKDGAQESLLAGVQKILDLETAGQAAFRNIYEIATQCETQQQMKTAQEIYTRIEARFKDHPDKQLAETIEKVIARGKIRTSLLDKPYEISGLTSDGTPLDWKRYQGKVVLIDFWATWCLPCIQELPNVIGHYNKYHEQGFEVLGVNLDEEPERVKTFLAQAPIPWTNIITTGEKTLGFDAPIAASNGIDKIPFTVLVARDGTVAAINLRGPELTAALEKLFPKEETPADKKPTPETPGKEKKQSLLQPARGTEFVAVKAAPVREAGSECGIDELGQADQEEDNQSNPYLAAPGLSAFDLVDYILDMQEKPRSIRKRAGFSDAVSEAADRVLASTKSDKLQVIAILGKSTILHERAQLGDDAADKKLVAFLQVIKDDKREKVVQEVRFLVVERQILEVDDLPLEKVTGLLDEIKKYLAGEKMTERHLRLASSVVHGINRLEDDKLRETYFADFGAVFSKSLDKQLSQYGKKLSRKPSQSSSDLVGKPLELTGTTALGTEFDWKQYRGKVILVDFWATWCGPCRRAMPQVKALYEKYQGKGFDIVAISLDRDLDALAKYLKENNIPWTNLAGDATQELARKYGVRGIPTMMLIDQAGKVVDVSHNVAQLAPRIEPLLKPRKPGAKEDQKD